MTRETYLHSLTDAMRPWFDEPYHGTIHISVGFPSRGALGRSKRRIGECWGPTASADGLPHIFISPLLGQDRVGDVLLHELCHAVVGVEHKHKTPFKRLAMSVGLTGKMTSTVASEELAARLTNVYLKLGDYPHVPIDPKALDAKKQTTRMIKIACDIDDYVLRGSRKVIAKGLPLCPICGSEMIADSPDDADDDKDVGSGDD